MLKFCSLFSIYSDREKFHSLVILVFFILFNFLKEATPSPDIA